MRTAQTVTTAGPAGVHAGQAEIAAAMFRTVFETALRLGSEPAPDRGQDCLRYCAGAGRSRTFGARADQVRAVRQFVRAGLAGHPAADAAVLVASELATNSVAHSGSARDGGVFVVHLAEVNATEVAVLLTETRGQGMPAVREAGPDAESGRGLAVVHALTSLFRIADTGEVRSLLAVIPAKPRGSDDGN